MHQISTQRDIYFHFNLYCAIKNAPLVERSKKMDVNVHRGGLFADGIVTNQVVAAVTGLV